RVPAGLSVPSVVASAVLASAISTTTVTATVRGVVGVVIVVSAVVSLLSTSHGEGGVHRAVVHFIVGREGGVDGVLGVGGSVLLLLVAVILQS
ncbi:hypothetical protein PFISCL1PPCAC_15939, partial [Pristionchus fissidentatus]